MLEVDSLRNRVSHQEAKYREYLQAVTARVVEFCAFVQEKAIGLSNAIEGHVKASKGSGAVGFGATQGTSQGIGIVDYGTNKFESLKVKPTNWAVAGATVNENTLPYGLTKPTGFRMDTGYETAISAFGPRVDPRLDTRLDTQKSFGPMKRGYSARNFHMGGSIPIEA